MFNSNDLSRVYFAKRLVMAMALLGYLGLSSAAMADQESYGTRSRQVILTDLDLSTSDGQRIALQRMRQMAGRLCSQVADDLDLSHHTNFLKCVDSAMKISDVQLQALVSRGSAARFAHNDAK